jgi:hypothetical protein
MPILLRHHRETGIATQKKAVLDVLLEFLEASKTLYGETSDSKDGKLHIDVYRSRYMNQSSKPHPFNL